MTSELDQTSCIWCERLGPVFLITSCILCYFIMVSCIHWRRDRKLGRVNMEMMVGYWLLWYWFGLPFNSPISNLNKRYIVHCLGMWDLSFYHIFCIYNFVNLNYHRTTTITISCFSIPPSVIHPKLGPCLFLYN